MSQQYVFPSSRSPYSTQQPVVYNTASHAHHGHGGYNYGTPLRRASSIGHAYPSSPAYGYSNVVSQPQAQFLTVPDSSHRSRSHSRHTSQSRPRHSSHSHGHGHGYNTTNTYPVTYATTAPVYVQPSHHDGHHRSHSTSHRHTSRSRSRPSHYHASNGEYYRDRTPSVGDRVRQFFGMEPSHYSSYGNQTHRRRNSHTGMRDGGHRNHSTRTGPCLFGSTSSRGYVDGHGREVDTRGRPIVRY
ncbi:uncharacterized protein EDB91DRAFT_427791 [Suillus paluster]|uniref:uncharacterized protein n=1 Tax=Suillus paluster TaxID=48578 RepID=UPI001B887037|nr:uncharacterized protein EDB91DRAFT_427791 [Suillus paluster]KAG1753961.1 hypothetical protein EDB91DRAFT_427791 [Suillus paluster]